MATNFPSSVDAFTNPSSSDTLDNPPHDQQHADVNDAVEAIETALLDGAPLHIDDANERVGIGVDSPAGKLTINHDNADGVVDFTDGLMFTNNSGGGATEWSHAGIVSTGSSGFNGNLVFGTDGDSTLNTSGVTERMRIDSSGNVGIGTTSPSYPLSFGAPSNNTQSVAIYESGTAFYGFGNDVNRLSFYASNSGIDERVSIDSSGTLRIYDGNFNVLTGVIESDGTYANTTGSGANMHISSGGFFFRSTSSGKYKTDVETMEDSYADAILQLRPVWYRSLSEHDPDGWGYWGFIAEEVAQVDPRLVTFGVPADYEWQYDDQGQKIDADVADLTEPESVQYDRIVPHLVNLVKRQQAQIDALETRLAALESPGVV